jgi:signal transduction histidine kinase
MGNVSTSTEILRTRDVVLLRYLLIIAVSYLVVSQRETATVPVATAGLVAAALTSNVLLGWLGPGSIRGWQIAAIVVVDTLWISAGMALVGRVSTEFFFLYFFVLFFAALAENLLLMLVGVGAASAAYLWVVARLYPGSVWEQSHLLQITFLFSAALCYGVLVNRTRTERRHAEIVEASDQARTELLATLAHDIGGPTHAISMGVETIQETLDHGGAAEARPLVVSIARNTRYLNQLVQHFMQYARLRAGRYRLEPMRVAVNAVVERAAAQHELAAQARGVALRLELAPLPTAVLDELGLERMVDNLVANAIRHSDPGSTVLVTTAPEREGVRITVGDSGAGIGPEVQAQLDRPFVEAPRTHGGVGLGLFIVRSIVEAHGGSFAIESKPGGGVRCQVWLPLVVEAARTTGFPPKDPAARSGVPPSAPDSSPRGPTPT